MIGIITKKKFLSIITLILILMLTGLVRQSLGDTTSDLDLDEIYQAVKQGTIQSLSTLLVQVQNKFPGEIVDIELEKEDNKWIYEFKVVSKNGRLLEIYVDAQDGSILQVENEH